MNARDIAYGYAIGYNDGLGSGIGGGETSDDWQPPADWPTVPEPGNYDINLLVEVTDNNNSGASIRIDVVRPVDVNTGNGQLSVDWGDGTTESWEGSVIFDENKRLNIKLCKCQ